MTVAHANADFAGEPHCCGARVGGGSPCALQTTSQTTAAQLLPIALISD